MQWLLLLTALNVLNYLICFVWCTIVSKGHFTLLTTSTGCYCVFLTVFNFLQEELWLFLDLRNVTASSSQVQKISAVTTETSHDLASIPQILSASSALSALTVWGNLGSVSSSRLATFARLWWGSRELENTAETYNVTWSAPTSLHTQCVTSRAGWELHSNFLYFLNYSAVILTLWNVVYDTTQSTDKTRLINGWRRVSTQLD